MPSLIRKKLLVKIVEAKLQEQTFRVTKKDVQLELFILTKDPISPQDHKMI